MREQGLAARRKKRRRATTRPGRGRWRAPDLVKRDFAAGRSTASGTATGPRSPPVEGKLYLASVLDMASRRVLGFALGEHHDAQLAYGALAMAVAVRGGRVPGVILHTDQGSEYTAGLVRQACKRLGISQSMGRPGSALDNAVIESWHSTLEFELRSLEHFTTRAAARARIAAWIENQHRPHPLTSTSWSCSTPCPLFLVQTLRSADVTRDPRRKWSCPAFRVHARLSVEAMVQGRRDECCLTVRRVSCGRHGPSGKMPSMAPAGNRAVRDLSCDRVGALRRREAA